MTGDSTSSIRLGYLYESEDGPRVALYCEPCTSFYVKCFGGNEELQAFKGGETFHRVSNCPYARGYPTRCSKHEVVYAGNAPPAMVRWLEGDRLDWPKCPEDFNDGEGDAGCLS